MALGDLQFLKNQDNYNLNTETSNNKKPICPLVPVPNKDIRINGL